MKKKPRLVVGVTGSSASIGVPYFVQNLISQLDAEVFVMMTESATQFVTPLSYRLLTRNTVITSFASETQNLDAQLGPIPHLELAKTADLVLILPATAEFIARAAHGLNNDPLSTCILATRAPVLFAPAMNSAMWESKALRRNLRIITEDLGYRVIPPRDGIPLSGAEMPEPGALAEFSVVLKEVCGVLKDFSF